jgi:DNA-binding NarL/FixJ family response regulator
MSKREPIRVLIVDDHREMAKGIEATLSDNEDIIVIDTLDRLPDPHNARLRFDICVLDLMGVATAEEITGFVAETPALIYSMEERWQQRLAAWVCGARSVVGKDVAGQTLVDAVRDAVDRPHFLSPHLAAALSEAVREYRLPVPAHLGPLLESFAGWQPPLRALAQHGVTEEQYAADLAALRHQCADAGLGRLEIWEPGTPWPAVTVSAGAVPLPQVHKLSPREQQVLEYRADGARIPEIATELGTSPHTVESQLKNAMARFGFATTASETHLLFAIYAMGRHRHPDRLRRQLLKLRRAQSATETSRPFLEL